MSGWTLKKELNMKKLLYLCLVPVFVTGCSPNLNDAITAYSHSGKPMTADQAEKAIAAGADVNQRNNSPSGQGRTPIIAAAAYNNMDVARVLINHRADVNAKDNDGLTALDQVCYLYDNPDMVRLLVSSGGNINSVSAKQSGATPLIWTVATGSEGKNPRPKCFKALLDLGADPLIKTTTKKETAYDLAIRLNNIPEDRMFLSLVDTPATLAAYRAKSLDEFKEISTNSSEDSCSIIRVLLANEHNILPKSDVKYWKLVDHYKKSCQPYMQKLEGKKAVIGISKSQLISILGIPQQSYKANEDTEFLTYQKGFYTGEKEEEVTTESFTYTIDRGLVTNASIK